MTRRVSKFGSSSDIRLRFESRFFFTVTPSSDVKAKMHPIQTWVSGGNSRGRMEYVQAAVLTLITS